ncbi:MAG: 4Fe-4S dicluster domain-containing protein [Candidatus Aminicenantes bacterium]|nr:4Fe-4S dicluster domain-containing protein [Candidatus Aminicenantes bacterium]
MNRPSPIKTAAGLVVLVVLIIALSWFSNRVWDVKSETLPEPDQLAIDLNMTVSQFGQANDLPDPLLKIIFGLEGKSELNKKLGDFGTAGQLASMVEKKMALAAENSSKNWMKIFLKFALWLVFLSLIFIFMKKQQHVSRFRKGLLFASVLLFGIVMGSDPSPMGTVKDAIHLYATVKVVFLPRLIALAVFLALVFLANKYICAWGCQLGTLQDLIFRINQSSRGKAVIGRQLKLPFILTNTVRLIFFLVFTAAAFLLAWDIVDPLDPFKIYKPAAIGLLGGLFIAALLVASLFVYRPWCHFFCPFGLAGWLVEKISLVRIHVNYETCIACQKCVAACPSTVMAAILKQDKKTIPDCFACYACREACPTGSIDFSMKKRTLPPANFFKNPAGQATSCDRIPVRR